MFPSRLVTSGPGNIGLITPLVIFFLNHASTKFFSVFLLFSEAYEVLFPEEEYFQVHLNLLLTASSQIVEREHVISVAGRHLLSTRPHLISELLHSSLNLWKEGETPKTPLPTLEPVRFFRRSGELEHRVTAGSNGARVWPCWHSREGPSVGYWSYVTNI